MRWHSESVSYKTDNRHSSEIKIVTIYVNKGFSAIVVVFPSGLDRNINHWNEQLLAGYLQILHNCAISSLNKMAHNTFKRN